MPYTSAEPLPTAPPWSQDAAYKIWSAWGASLGESKAGAKVGILGKKVAWCPYLPSTVDVGAVRSRQHTVLPPLPAALKEYAIFLGSLPGNAMFVLESAWICSVPVISSSPCTCMYVCGCGWRLLFPIQTHAFLTLHFTWAPPYQILLQFKVTVL